MMAVRCVFYQLQFDDRLMKRSGTIGDSLSRRRVQPSLTSGAVYFEEFGANKEAIRAEAEIRG
jgi:hypothetical protein